MFYDRSLMNSEVLGSVWKLANNMSAQNIEDCNLPTICTELDSWVSSDAVLPHRRLSLRASSQLIGGVAKLYKSGVRKLFDDINKLDEDIILRRKRGCLNNLNTSVSSELSESVATPEQMRRQADMGFDSSISPKKRRRIDSKSKIPQRLTMSRCSSETVSYDARDETDKECSTIRGSDNNCQLYAEPNDESDDDSSSGNALNSDEDLEVPEKDREGPSSPILISKERPKFSNHSHDGFERNMPFAYILIHDNYDCRIPSKIILTSINRDVKNFI